MRWAGWVVGADFTLHPLIHTIAPETSAQDVEKKKAEPKTPHFLSLNQDIVARSQEAKVEIKVCKLKFFTISLGLHILTPIRPSFVKA